MFAVVWFFVCFSWGEGCDLFCVALGFSLGVGLVLFVCWLAWFIYLFNTHATVTAQMANVSSEDSVVQTVQNF